MVVEKLSCFEHFPYKYTVNSQDSRKIPPLGMRYNAQLNTFILVEQLDNVQYRSIMRHK